VNATRKLPGLAHYANIVLRRGITGDSTLWRWFDEVRDGNVARRDVAVVLLDESRQPVVRWRLQNAFPVKWKGPDLNAKGNEVAIETLELAVERIDLDE
jgi:phage tail-like protein